MTEKNKSGALRVDGAPNVQAMQHELTSACEQAERAYALQVNAENVRLCKWPDQDESGRKPDLVDGRRAEPWPGASDVRIRLADEIVVDQVRLMKKVARTAKLTARGTEGADLRAAGKVQIYLDHLRNTKLKAELKAQNELAAQWRQTFGYALTAITWRQEYERVYDNVTFEQLQAQAMQPGPMASALLEFLDLAKSPDSDDRRLAARQLVQMYEDLELGEAYRQVQVFRTTGAMSLPRRRLRVNRPSWQALKVWRDVFLPLNCPEDIQAAPWIAWRMTLTETQLADKQLAEGWDQEFVAAVKKTTGSTILDSLTTINSEMHRRDLFADDAEEMAGLHEVFVFYYRVADEQGVPCIHRTVMSPHIGKKQGEPEADLYGLDEPLGYEHGQLPFIKHQRELLDSMLAESRGVPELVNTNQAEIKWQRDARTDQTDLALRPPTIRPEREVGLPLSIEPMGEIGERRVQALRFLPTPPVPPHSPGLEADARRDADRYFARNRAENPVGASLADQDLADDWADELAEGWRMTLQLAQQFESSVTFNRLVGGEPTAFSVGRDEIQGQHDIQLFFNTDSLDPERMKAKTEVLQKMILPMDRTGTVDLAPIVRGLVGYYLPEFADLALRDEKQATQAEVRDEMNNWNLILGGTEPEMAEDGQNFQLRLMWLQQKMQEPGAQARLAQMPDSQAIAQRRLEHLQFQVQQKTVNANTGRLGVAPSAQPGLSA